MAATRLSDQEEIDIGNELARTNWYLQSSADRTLEQKQQDKLVQDNVYRVGAKVAARAHRKLPYKFHYIPNMDFVNAFALPGGHVYIGAGLVALMDSEDELAAVLGHEIEHIDHYHCIEREQMEQRLRKIPLGNLVGIPLSIFEAGYSKDQELEADREGTQLAVWAGYSPLGAVRMFETFDRLYQEYVKRAKSPQEELSQVAIQTIEGYFRSHPLPSERIEQIRKLIAENIGAASITNAIWKSRTSFGRSARNGPWMPDTMVWRSGLRNTHWKCCLISLPASGFWAMRNFHSRILLRPPRLIAMRSTSPDRYRSRSITTATPWQRATCPPRHSKLSLLGSAHKTE